MFFRLSLFIESPPTILRIALLLLSRYETTLSDDITSDHQVPVRYLWGLYVFQLGILKRPADRKRTEEARGPGPGTGTGIREVALCSCGQSGETLYAHTR